MRSKMRKKSSKDAQLQSLRVAGPHQLHGIWGRDRLECIGPVSKTQSLSKLWVKDLVKRSTIKNASTNLSCGRCGRRRALATIVRADDSQDFGLLLWLE